MLRESVAPKSEVIRAIFLVDSPGPRGRPGPIVRGAGGCSERQSTGRWLGQRHQPHPHPHHRLSNGAVYMLVPCVPEIETAAPPSTLSRCSNRDERAGPLGPGRGRLGWSERPAPRAELGGPSHLARQKAAGWGSVAVERAAVTAATTAATAATARGGRSSPPFPAVRFGTCTSELPVTSAAAGDWPARTCTDRRPMAQPRTPLRYACAAAVWATWGAANRGQATGQGSSTRRSGELRRRGGVAARGAAGGLSRTAGRWTASGISCIRCST